MDDKKNKILERLEQSRQQKGKLIEASAAAGAGTIGRDPTSLLFQDSVWLQQEFDERVRDIEQMFAAHDEDGVDIMQREAVRGQIISACGQLDKLLTEYVVNLPAFDARRAQDTIQTLNERHKKLSSTDKPRKAFAFSKKSTQKKVPTTEKEAPEEADSQPKKQFDFLNEAGQEDMSRVHAQLTDQQLVIDNADAVDLTLSNLTRCVVSVRCAPSTIHASHLVSCTLLARPVKTSVFVDGATNCTLAVACQQLRMHNSSDVRLYVHVTSSAIIENCTGVQTAPYPTVPDRQQQFDAAGLSAHVNNWDRMQDFNWLASGSDQHSPNWSLLPDEARQQLDIL